MRESTLLVAARDGDGDAFRELVAPHLPALHLHCYRMLGSYHDAEEVMQDVLLRAWRFLAGYRQQAPLLHWLYRIATTTSLKAIEARARRPGTVAEIDYLEPYPDRLLDALPADSDPAAVAERRESVSLAFIAALQLLPANQRAVLILREVLGFSAQEAADALETSTASVNSALQRARASVDDKLPEQSQQQTLRELGDEKVRELVEDYVAAWERDDVDTVVSMLAEDATFTMPPLASWFGGRDQIAIFLAGSPMSGDWDWRALRVRANGQEALGFYAWSDESQSYERFALNVLTFRGERISDVTAFITTVAPSADREVVLRMPEHAYDPVALAAAFENFGLPERLERDGREH